jgi:uncharacterized BrkB/YihY/UPF0761 family membrane protein
MPEAEPDEHEPQSPTSAEPVRHDLTWLRTTLASTRERAGTVASSLDDHRDSLPPLDVAMRLYDRDRTVVGAVLGSAVAFRLFLFFVPTALFFTALISFEVAGISAEDAAEAAGVSQTLTAEIEESLSTGSVTKWFALAAGLLGALWAGRSLAKVLTACSALAWSMAGPRRSPSVRVIGAVVGLISIMGLAAGFVNRVRQAAGLAVATTAVLGVALVYAAAWFFVSLALPRATNDPSALLPGAALVGLAMGGLQWFVQLYAADQISGASAVYGSFGLVVVTLGWFFILGRLFVAANVVNAVIWERFGSIAEFVFSLPGIRAIPRRFRFVARFFDLDPDTDADAASGRAGGGSPQ